MSRTLWPRLERDARRRLLDDRGSMAPFTMGVVVLLIGIAGFGFDVWSAISERRALAEACDAAARAGATAIDLDEFDRTGIVRLDPAAAQARANDNLSAQDPDTIRSLVAADMQADQDRVTCLLDGRVEFGLLRIFGEAGIDLEVRSVAEPRARS